MLTLIARWNRAQDPAVDMPARVTWGRKRPAMLQDYITHREDTGEMVETPRGAELRMYPELVADVRYDYYTGLWWVVPPCETTCRLTCATRQRTKRSSQSWAGCLGSIDR